MSAKLFLIFIVTLLDWGLFELFIRKNASQFNILLSIIMFAFLGGYLIFGINPDYELVQALVQLAFALVFFKVGVFFGCKLLSKKDSRYFWFPDTCQFINVIPDYIIPVVVIVVQWLFIFKE